MAVVLAVVESAARITHIVSVGTAPAWKHNIPDLLKSQPESVRQAFDTLAGSAVDLVTLHEWRQSNNCVRLRQSRHLRPTSCNHSKCRR